MGIANSLAAYIRSLPRPQPSQPLFPADPKLIKDLCGPFGRPEVEIDDERE